MSEEEIDWDKIFTYYTTIKKLYAECEETDPELKTNLQPLNEFRAALDHLMRVVAIEKFPEFKDKDAKAESNRLQSHLRRAFFDICDMLSMNYRNKIIDAMRVYAPDTIQMALPRYYAEIKPDIEQMSQRIATLRTESRFSKHSDEPEVDVYYDIVCKLRDYYVEINKALPSFNEIHNKHKARNIIKNWIIPAAGLALTALGIILTVVSCAG